MTLSSIPKTQKVIKCHGPGSASLVQDGPVPDYPALEAYPQPGYKDTVGCDYSGTVAAIGPDVTKKFRVGDRVAGFAHGLKHEDPKAGCFAEWAKVKGDIQIKIPDGVSFDEAASWPTGINTVGQGMYSHDGLQLPTLHNPEDGPFDVLIYGASTNTGVWAIQYAKLSGLRALAVCSERNFEAVKDLGADQVFDYHDEDCAQRIHDAAGGKPMYAFDCVSEGDSMEICAQALTTSPSKDQTPKYGSLLPVEFPRKDVKHSFTIGYSANGEPFTFFGDKILAKPKDFEFAKHWWATAEDLLAEGKLKGTPTLRPGGLQGIFQGLDDLRNGKVSMQKLVYRISDTSCERG